MANEYTFLKITDVIERRDDNGEVRISAQCIEMNPRNYSINLSRQNADFINQCKQLKGKPIMFPTREGSYNDRSFVAVGEGPLLLAASHTVAPAIPAMNKQ